MNNSCIRPAQFALFLWGAVQFCQPVVAEPPRPNILYFYVDDMGWGSIGPNGQADRRADGRPSVQTPHIDRLAAQGVNFRRAYACTVCSPSRASQQSGYHQGHAFSDRNDPNNARKAMRADDVLMGDVLSAAGYRTGYWGKWGYGGSKDLIDPVIDNVQTLPTSHGYQHVVAELHHVRAHTFFQPTLWKAPATKAAPGGLQLIENSMTAYQNNPRYPDTPALQNHPDYPATAYCDDVYAFSALDFVRARAMDYRATGHPFFGLLAVQIPHAPFGEITALPDWDRVIAGDPKFDSLAEQTRQWAAMVSRIDAHFGNILAALEDPDNDGDTSDSVAENTLVIFQSDNGGPGGKNNEELDANGGLRGKKGQIHEGGIRVPMVMRWPGRIHQDSALKSATSTDMIVDITDLLPTFCELAGATTPAGVDGVSLAPTLLGTGHQRKRPFVIHEAGNGQSIIRNNHKLIRTKNGRLELYDLVADHAETRDIAAENPELVRELETLLIGERVTEPKGFANTYHHWTGADGDRTSDPNHWSDYRYGNAGITYQTDDGAPQLSWTARMENTGRKSSMAVAEQDLEFLSLEINGRPDSDVLQSLVLASGAGLTGRNEIRLGFNGALTVNGGTVSSVRWVDIHSGGLLNGAGVIDSTVYNAGVFEASDVEASGFRVLTDFRQSADGTLEMARVRKSKPALQVVGSAVLGGTLKLTTPADFRPAAGSEFRIIQAGSIAGRFTNANDEVTSGNGTRFGIHYSSAAVKLSVK